MAEEEQQKGSQSMEEILASIRSIIAGGEDPAAREQLTATVEDALGSSDDGDLKLEADAPRAELLELARVAQGGSDAALLSPEARANTSGTLAALENTLVRGYEGSENTLEGLIRELLRPMLKEWLDAHLPGLVERMVAREISRIRGE